MAGIILKENSGSVSPV